MDYFLLAIVISLKTLRKKKTKSELQKKFYLNIFLFLFKYILREDYTN